MAIFALVSLSLIAWSPPQSAGVSRSHQVRQTLDAIKARCQITTGQFSYDEDLISFRYDGMIEREKLDCARDLVNLIDVNLEAFDTSEPHSGPSRFLVKGPTYRLSQLAEHNALTEWTIVRRADASDGIGFLEIEPKSDISRKSVEEFRDLFSVGQFGDLAITLSPWTIYGLDPASAGAAFRKTARSMYEAERKPSCNGQAGLKTVEGFNRDTRLVAERAAIAEFETDVAGSVAEDHLMIAKEDSAIEDLGCWNDSAMWLAERHLESDREAINAGIDKLRELAKELQPVSLAAPPNAAQFRAVIADIEIMLDPLCRMTSKGTNDEVLAESRARLGAYRELIEGSLYAEQFDIAREDTKLSRVGLIAECDDPSDDPIIEVGKSIDDDIAALIGKARQLMR